MYQLIIIIHVLAAVCLIALVLVQQGKGATTGAAFGSGASQTVFGSRGSGSFLFRVTSAFVAVFFSTSLLLNYMASQAVKQEGQLIVPAAQQIPQPTTQPQPQAAPEAPVNTAPTPSSIPSAAAPTPAPVVEKQVPVAQKPAATPTQKPVAKPVAKPKKQTEASNVKKKVKKTEIQVQ